jgi:hypothetical protein
MRAYVLEKVEAAMAEVTVAVVAMEWRWQWWQ